MVAAGAVAAASVSCRFDIGLLQRCMSISIRLQPVEPARNRFEITIPGKTTIGGGSLGELPDVFRRRPMP